MTCNAPTRYRPTRSWARSRIPIRGVAYLRIDQHETTSSGRGHVDSTMANFISNSAMHHRMDKPHVSSLYFG